MLIKGSPMYMLAIPNYMLFLLSNLIGIGLTRQLLSEELQRMVVVGIATFYALEVTRWLAAIWHTAGLMVYADFLVDPRTYLVSTALIAPMAFTARAAWRTRMS